MRFLAVLSSCTGGASNRRLRIMSTENFSRSRLVLCKVMSGLQIISQFHSSLRAPLALLHAQSAAFDEGFIAPFRELQSIITRNGFTHTAQAELVTYAAHETASPSLSQWLEAYLRDTGVKRMQRCIASLRDAGTTACSSLSLITSNMVYVLTELRAWAAGHDYVAVGLQPPLLTEAIEKGLELLRRLEQLQGALTLHCSGARALAMWISNAFKLLADPSTHVPDFSVAVRKEALHFVHARLWCKDLLDLMGSSGTPGSSSASSGSGSTGGGSGGSMFMFGSANTASPAAPAAPTQAPIESACDALKAACTACSAAVGHAVTASIHPAFVADIPQQRSDAGGDVFVFQGEEQETGFMVLSLRGGPAAGAPTHSVEFTRVVEGDGGWRLEQAKSNVALKVSSA